MLRERAGQGRDRAELVAAELRGASTSCQSGRAAGARGGATKGTGYRKAERTPCAALERPGGGGEGCRASADGNRAISAVQRGPDDTGYHHQQAAELAAHVTAGSGIGLNSKSGA